MVGLRIRQASATDVPFLVSLGQGDVDGWGFAQYAAELALPMSRIFVVEGPVPDAPEGPCVVLACLVRWNVAGETQVLNLVVHPLLRRQGLGQLLLGQVVQEAIQLGHRQILLEVGCDNVAARALYEAMGFVTSGRRDGYYAQSGSDALLMSRLLPAQSAGNPDTSGALPPDANAPRTVR